jgi:hypothetical protein
VSFDWRKEFERQFGHAPGAVPEPGKGVEAEARQPAADLPVDGSVEPELVAGEGHPSSATNFERVESAPNQFVNLSAARTLGLVRKAGG